MSTVQTFLSNTLFDNSVVQQDPNEQQAQQLLERVASGSLMERKDALQEFEQLLEAAPRLSLSAASIDILAELLDPSALETKDTDAEVVNQTLGLLLELVKHQQPASSSGGSGGGPHSDADDGSDADETKEPPVDERAVAHVSHFLQGSRGQGRDMQTNMGCLIALLKHRVLATRLKVLQLLIELASTKPGDVQNLVLQEPQAVFTIMEVVNDKRDMVRTLILLLLDVIVEDSVTLQKIVAFEGAFERLLHIVHEEGGVDGGIIVEDCLNVILKLVKDNRSNQDYVGSMDVNCIPLLAPLLKPVSPNHASIARLALEIVWHIAHSIGSSVCKGTITGSVTQTQARLAAVLPAVLGLSAEAKTAEVRVQCLQVAGLVVRNSPSNQMVLGAIPIAHDAGGTSVRRSSLWHLLHTALYSPSYDERFWSEYVLECYLLNNSQGQFELLLSFCSLSAVSEAMHQLFQRCAINPPPPPPPPGNGSEPSQDEVNQHTYRIQKAERFASVAQRQLNDLDGGALQMDPPTGQGSFADILVAALSSPGTAPPPPSADDAAAGMAPPDLAATQAAVEQSFLSCACASRVLRYIIHNNAFVKHILLATPACPESPATHANPDGSNNGNQILLDRVLFALHSCSAMVSQAVPEPPSAALASAHTTQSSLAPVRQAQVALLRVLGEWVECCGDAMHAVFGLDSWVRGMMVSLITQPVTPPDHVNLPGDIVHVPSDGSQSGGGGGGSQLADRESITTHIAGLSAYVLALCLEYCCTAPAPVAPDVTQTGKHANHVSVLWPTLAQCTFTEGLDHVALFELLTDSRVVAAAVGGDANSSPPLLDAFQPALNGLAQSKTVRKAAVKEELLVHDSSVPSLFSVDFAKRVLDMQERSHRRVLDLYKAALSRAPALLTSPKHASPEAADEIARLNNELSEMRNTVRRLKGQERALQVGAKMAKNKAKEALERANQLQQQLDEVKQQHNGQASSSAPSSGDVDTRGDANETWTMSQLQAEVQRLRRELEDARSQGQGVTNSHASADAMEELRQQVAVLTAQRNHLQQRLAADQGHSHGKGSAVDTAAAEWQEKYQQLAEQHQQLTAEHEDLLILLAVQDLSTGGSS